MQRTMLMAAAAALAAGWTVSAMTGSAVAGPVQGACTDNSKACLVAAAKSYIDGLMARDGSKVQFGVQVKLTEHGGGSTQTEAEARAAVDREVPMKGYRNARYVADPESRTVVQLVEMDLTMSKEVADRMKTQPGDQVLYVANTFTVENGLITAIDSRFHMAPPRAAGK